MKRIYLILPKVLNTKPPMKVNSGYAISQAHHVSVLGARRTDLKLSPYLTVITLQVPNSRSLKKLAAKMHNEGLRFQTYTDEVSARNNQECLSAIVTEPVEHKPESLRLRKLWR